MEDAILDGAILIGIDAENQMPGAFVEDAILTQEQFDRFMMAIREEEDFTERPELGREDFSRRTLPRAHFEDTNLTNTMFLHSSLRGAFFNRAQLTETRFTESDLTDAIFEDSILTRANFAGSILVRANFEEATLRGSLLDAAILIRANLRNAILEGVQGNRTLFIYADLTGANMQHIRFSHCDFRGAIMQDVDLRGANLTMSDLRGVNLSGVDLTGATLAGVDFRHVDLTGANLSGASLVGADLRHATVTGANFTGADLTGIRVVRGGLEGAIGVVLEPPRPVPVPVPARARALALAPVPVPAPGPVIMPGIAFNVHNLNKKFLQIRNKYLRLISEKVGHDIPPITLPELRILFTDIINSSDLSDEIKARTILQLNTVIERMGAHHPTREEQEVVNYTIAYLVTLPDSAQLIYVTTFVGDCANAYTGANSFSCGSGSYERIHLVLDSALIALKSENEESCDATCNEILNLFSREFSFNGAIQGWKANIGSSGLPPSIIAKHIEVDEGRSGSYDFTDEELEEQFANFYNYAITEYKTIYQVDVVPQNVTHELRVKKGEFIGMLKDVLIGGRRHRHRLSRRKRKSNTSNKRKSQRSSGKRKIYKTLGIKKTGGRRSRKLKKNN